MSNTETLEQIAKLLPASERERFFALIARFKSVPEDDEYLLLLNAIGFMTLLWKEVPREIEAILAGANPVTETCLSISQQIREAVITSIPSYEDLRLIGQQLNQHEMSLRRLLQQARSPRSGFSSVGLALVLAFLCGVVCGGWFLPWLSHS